VFLSENPNASEEEIENYLRSEMIRLDNEKQTIFSAFNYNQITGFFCRGNAMQRTLFSQHPIQSVIAYNASRDTITKVLEFYENDEDDGNQNAFKHAYWNALMTFRLNASWAKLFGDAHEWGQDENCRSTLMDYVNNEIGIRDAETFSYLSESALARQIMIRVSYGYYWRIINGVFAQTCTEILRPQFLSVLTPLTIHNNTVRHFTLPPDFEGHIDIFHTV
jgi:hypothetical protein